MGHRVFPNDALLHQPAKEATDDGAMSPNRARLEVALGIEIGPQLFDSDAPDAAPAEESQEIAKHLPIAGNREGRTAGRF